MQCQLKPMEGSDYCYYHNNADYNIDFVHDYYKPKNDKTIHINKNMLLPDKIITNCEIGIDKRTDIVIDDMYINTKISILRTLHNETYLKGLIGPVYDDITLCENSHDPITFDIFWENRNGTRYQIYNPEHVYLLFSYIDNEKIKCVTIWTLYEYLEIKPDFFDIYPKAKEFLDLYINIGFFSENVNECIRDLNKMIRVLKKYDFYYEIEWFEKMDINLLKNMINKYVNDLQRINISQNNKKILIDITKNLSKSIDYEYCCQCLVNFFTNLIDMIDDESKKKYECYNLTKMLGDICKEVRDKYPI